jgi:hypothetical protein
VGREKRSVEATAMAIEKEIWNDDDATRTNGVCEETSDSDTDTGIQPPTTSHTRQ